MSAQAITDTLGVLQDSGRRNWFWDHNYIFELGLSCHAIVVRLYLAKCAGKNRQAWPSLSNIAAHCGISRKTAKRAINELIQKGLLHKEILVSEAGDYASNVYISTDPEQLDPGRPKPGDRIIEKSGEGRGILHTSPCNEMSGGRVPQTLPRVRQTLGRV